MTDGLSAHLTQPNADLGAKIAATPSGMAFWAGTGPANTTCRECLFFDHQKSYYAKKGVGGGQSKACALQEVFSARQSPRRQGRAQYPRLQVFRASGSRSADYFEVRAA